VQTSRGRAVDAAFGAIADNAIEVFGGPLREQLRACPGPNCILYFLTDGRREWCSKQCGNRARAARHYAKNRRTSHGPVATSIGE
jgi:predicted RNA-binding Zn ribbon-like protein